MPLKIPSTQSTVDNNLQVLESKLNQTSPLNDKSFLRVLSVMTGMNHTQLYKFGAERAIQNLALTATEKDLDTIGINYKVTRKPGQPAVLQAESTGTDGVVIPATISYVGDGNGVRYFLAASVTVSGGVASLELTAEDIGDSGNLQVDDTLTISTQVAGVTTFSAVTAINQAGTDREEDEVYRIRVLDEIRTVGGGSNKVDYRTWAQEAETVERAYSYTGKPFGSIPASIPGDRTVYVKAISTIDPDGIANTTVKDDARDLITTDPATGQERQCLGSTDDTLYVESISRVDFLFTVIGLNVSAAREADAKAAIETALEEYARGTEMFVDGLDVEISRNDTISSLSASEVVNNVLRSFAGYANVVSFGFVPGTYLPPYTLNPGELGGFNGVIYD